MLCWLESRSFGINQRVPEVSGFESNLRSLRAGLFLLTGFFYLSIMYFIYFIYSEKYDIYYVGFSDDPERRVVEHNTNPRRSFTQKFRPWVLKIYLPVNDKRGDALKVERFIKRQKSRRLITNIINHPEIFKDIIKKVLK